ncbi:MAG: histidine kinase N-terminal 7TM domain-containing protein [Daejeonella sp.]
MFNAFYLLPITLLLAGLVTFIISLQFLTRPVPAVRWFGILMISISEWAVGAGLELFSIDLESKLFWTFISYIGIIVLPPSYLIFCLKFTGKDYWLKRWHILLLFVVPVISLIAIALNSYHHQYYTTLIIEKLGPLTVLNIKGGIFYKIFISYFYILLVWGFAVLVSAYRDASHIHKNQYKIILFGAFLPWLANSTYLLGYQPYNLDITPFAFTFSVLILAYGLRKYKIFKLIPAGLTQAIEQMTDGVIIINNSLIVNYVNKSISGLFSENPVKLGYPLSNSLNDQELLEFIAKGETSRKEIKYFDNYYETTATPLYDHNLVTGTVIIVRDITTAKMADFRLQQQADELQKLNDLKNKLFSVISHDLRSPMANIQNLIMMANDNQIDKDELWGLIPDLSKQVNETTELMTNLFSWSKMQIEEDKLFPVAISLSAFIGETVAKFKDKALQKGISLQSCIDEDVEAFCDKGSLELIFRNLISNAIKFCSKGDIISIEAYSRDGIIEISCIDSGVGIPLQIQNQLFNSLSVTTPGTLMETGSGFGLAISFEYALRNFGKILVDSEINVGSKFTLILPPAEKSRIKFAELG